MLSSYVGACLRVRRDDATEQDIGFATTGWLDTAALLTFTGSGSGYVVTWYDQSGHGSNATQAVPGQQPRLVNAGTIETLASGRPALYFEGVDDGLATAALPTAAVPQAMVVARSLAFEAQSRLLSWRMAGDSEDVQLILSHPGTVQGVAVQPDSTVLVATSVASPALNQDFAVLAGLATDGTLKLKLDGAAVVSAGTGSSIRAPAAPFIALGYDQFSPTTFHRMHLGEAIAWDADLTASWATLYTQARIGFFLP